MPVGRGSGQQADSQAQFVVETLKTFNLSEEEFAGVKQRIISEIERRAPQFLKSIAIAAALPVMQPRAKYYYVSKNVPPGTAEDLGSQFVLKVLSALYPKEVHGNSGAWLARIRNNVLLDHWRAAEREKRRFGKRADVASLAEVPLLDQESWPFAIEDLPPRARETVERLLEDPKWNAISAQCKEQIDELKQALQSLEWDGESVPLRKKRRR